MKPIHYRIHLEPDLQAFRFQGLTEIEIETEGPASHIVLNAVDLAFQRCQVSQDGRAFACPFSFAPQRQEVTIELPREMEGRVQVSIAYQGAINDLLVGFYRSRYERNGQERYVAVTQFEERDARRAFPCFDHPAQKATFDIALLIPRELAAIANTAIAQIAALAIEVPQGSKKLVCFERTPPMSTYLLFFGVGEFEFIADASATPLVRVAATPGKVQYGQFALQMGRKSLQFGQAYTGIDFPISKCDHIAVPDFAFGAMENYGAITYRENALLVYPGVTSQFERASIASTIAHETIHMWFGDLVSPAEWKYIWLNESFATYFTHLITDYYYPEWQWKDMMIARTALGGMERDTLLETVPIELPGDQPVQIDPSSAPIIYNKGAAIIRMLAAYLGEDKLREGINHFLRQYQFDCATSQQYWQAFEEATGEPIGQFADSWVYQAGYPIVRARVEQRIGKRTNRGGWAERVPGGGNQLHLTQQRFTFSTCASDQVWFMPIEIMFYLENGNPMRLRTLLTEKSTSLDIPPHTVAFKVNCDQAGFYRVAYEGEILAQLGQLIQEKRLPAIDRFGVENDLFAMVLSGECALTAYLDFVETCFGDEDSYLPLFDMARNLMTLYLVVEQRREEIGRIGRTILERALETFGLEPQEGESLPVSAIRDVLLWALFTFGSPRAAAFGATRFQDLLDGTPVHADILSSTLKIGAATDDRAAGYFLRRLASADTAEAEVIAILNALGCFQDKEKLSTAWQWNLEEVPKKNRAYLISAAAQNPLARDWLWEWFLANLEPLSSLHPLHFGRVLVSVVPTCGLGKEDRVNAFLAGLVQGHPEARDTAHMALEMLQVYARLRNAG